MWSQEVKCVQSFNKYLNTPLSIRRNSQSVEIYITVVSLTDLIYAFIDVEFLIFKCAYIYNCRLLFCSDMYLIFLHFNTKSVITKALWKGSITIRIKHVCTTCRSKFKKFLFTSKKLLNVIQITFRHTYPTQCISTFTTSKNALLMFRVLQTSNWLQQIVEINSQVIYL